VTGEHDKTFSVHNCLVLILEFPKCCNLLFKNFYFALLWCKIS